jgi:pre-60S factor REI1
MLLLRKSYFSENAFSNHLLSKKHKDLEFNADKEPLPSPVVVHKKEFTLFSDTEEDTDNENHSVVSSAADLHLSQDRCLFCNFVSGDFDSNLKHMSRVHGFFLPDVEYLDDAPGLIIYLAEKVDDCICLYCNGRGKEWKTQNAVRKHMVNNKVCGFSYSKLTHRN